MRYRDLHGAALYILGARAMGLYFSLGFPVWNVVYNILPMVTSLGGRFPGDADAPIINVPPPPKTAASPLASPPTALSHPQCRA